MMKPAHTVAPISIRRLGQKIFKAMPLDARLPCAVACELILSLVCPCSQYKNIFCCGEYSSLKIWHQPPGGRNLDFQKYTPLFHLCDPRWNAARIIALNDRINLIMGIATLIMGLFELIIVLIIENFFANFHTN